MEDNLEELLHIEWMLCLCALISTIGLAETGVLIGLSIGKRCMWTTAAFRPVVALPANLALLWTCCKRSDALILVHLFHSFRTHTDTTHLRWGKIEFAMPLLIAFDSWCSTSIVSVYAFHIVRAFLEQAVVLLWCLSFGFFCTHFRHCSTVGLVGRGSGADHSDRL